MITVEKSSHVTQTPKRGILNIDERERVRLGRIKGLKTHKKQAENPRKKAKLSPSILLNIIVVKNILYVHYRPLVA
jgi:hypothetical protein